MLSGTEVEETTETKEKEEVKDAVDTPWRLILYDDDIHTFDEVISQLMKATGCSLSEAEDKTWKVHNEGKALVHEGEFEECLRIDGVLKEIQLVTEIKG
ncbi:ATP-dependent Clp protease adaptor ClpS [Gracilimonas sp. CAU 1638]|uniref:ATP-dependent Clp protease adaptor ClpS n=1 Tax=Gracilimonas sediminicola TaxID=2952158 RepID=A0A9X2L332_9BACT|nr:ATP-dependent Clp protease adaptor ClpS [Gracilimonas sediminicola]